MGAGAKFLLFAGISAVLLVAPPAKAETVIKGGHPVCNSAEHIDDAVRAFELGDSDWFERLEGCYELNPGTAIERVSGGFFRWGTCKARVGFGKIVWTPCANIKNE